MSNLIVEDLKRHLDARGVEEEDFASMIVQSTIDGIYTYDRDLTITMWNKGMERITGFKKEDVLGRGLFQRFPFLLEDLRDLVREPLKGVTSPETEGPWQDPATGRGGFNRRRFSPLRNELGEIVGGLAIVHAITEQKRAETEVAVTRKAESRIKFLSDAGMLLSSTLEYTEVLRRIIDLSTRQFGALVKVRLLEDDGRLSVFEGHQNAELAARFAQIEAKYPPPEDLEMGPHSILRNGGHHFRPVCTFDPAKMYSQEPEFLALLALMRAYICVPLETHGKISGTYTLIGTDRTFTDEDLSLAYDLARWIALAISNARMYARGRSPQ